MPETAGGMSRITVVSFLGVAQILSWGSSYYLPAVLAGPITADTGWPAGWVVGALSIGLLISGLVSPRVGRLIESYGGRLVLAAGAVLMAAGQAVIGSAPSLPVYFAGWLIMGIGMGAGLYNPAFSTLGRLYGEKARGAITHVTLFGGFASTLCWPLSAVLAANLGWRGVCFTYAAAHLLIVLPIYLFILPREKTSTPGPADTVPVKSSSVGKGSRAAFILLASGLTLASLVMTVLSVHLLALLQARGLELAAAVSLGALMGPSQVGARVLEAAFGNRLHPVWSLAIAVVAVTAGLGIMAGAPGIVAAGIVLYGAGNGIRSIAGGTVPLALFGRQGYAVLMGRLSLPILVAQAVSPLIGTFLIRNTGPDSTMHVLFGLSLVSILIVGALVPYAFRVREACRSADDPGGPA